MNYKSKGLHNLLVKDEKAKDYFMSLPEYVQGSVSQCVDDISTFDSLRDYSTKLMNNI